VGVAAAPAAEGTACATSGPAAAQKAAAWRAASTSSPRSRLTLPAARWSIFLPQSARSPNNRILLSTEAVNARIMAAMDEFTGYGQGLAKTFVAGVESGDPAHWAAMFTDDATYVVPDSPDAIQGRQALEAMAATFFTAFPDMAFVVRSIIEQGNVVVLEGATKGTFTGPMTTAAGEIPPTGKSYEAPLVAVCELTDTGLIMACREYYDTAAFATQLGLAG
jgi:steroid delta-isomerase-like uncharacterized protein